MSLRKTLRFRVRLQLSQSRCLSLLLAMSGRVFLFLLPRGHDHCRIYLLLLGKQTTVNLIGELPGQPMHEMTLFPVARGRKDYIDENGRNTRLKTNEPCWTAAPQRQGSQKAGFSASNGFIRARRGRDVGRASDKDRRVRPQ